MQNSLKFPEELTFLPAVPGVYLMKDLSGKIIYVGKAKSLKHRVASYRHPHDPKTAALSSNIATVEFIVTSSQDEALLLENNLIKKYLPHYNIRLVDDENYPYIKITDEKYPRMMKVYHIRGENGFYFGPFPYGRAVDLTIKAIRKIFPVRTCNVKINDKKPITPCLAYHIGLCTAPCANKISEKEYATIVDSLKRFLNGETNGVIKQLNSLLDEAKNNMKFEEAIIYRDELKSIASLMEKQRVVVNQNVSFDVFAMEVGEKLSCVVKVSVRGGRVLASYPFIINTPKYDTKGEIIQQFIMMYPFHAQADKIYFDLSIPNRVSLEHFIYEKTGRKVSLLKARGALFKDILSFAHDNAKTQLLSYLEKHNGLAEEHLMLSIKDLLRLTRIPRRIEGYDISNVSGVFAVGSMVVFENAKPSKKEYRKFRIRLFNKPNDYGMMFEVLARRFKEKDANFASSKPDLLLIDGGLGQLAVASKVKSFLNVDVDIASIAKKEELIYVEGCKEPIKLEKGSKELMLLQQVRDESHRFAKAYFSKLHIKSINQTKKRS
ncbi:MAG: excinuclease ABC subunit UvrC [Caldisericaceae bacterium]